MIGTASSSSSVRCRARNASIDPGSAVQSADLVTGLRLVQLDQLDRAVGRAGEGVQHRVEIGVVLFQHLQPRVEAWIGGRQLGEVAVILPAVVAMQVANQRPADSGQPRGVVLGRKCCIQVALGIEADALRPYDETSGARPATGGSSRGNPDARPSCRVGRRRAAGASRRAALGGRHGVGHVSSMALSFPHQSG